MKQQAWRPGRDPKAVRHPGGPGRLRPAGEAPGVVVVGGGIAGLAAAAALAERGVVVTLLEREQQLGGRVGAWPVGPAEDGRTMSRGFHAFFRQYYNLRALLRRSDPGLAALTPIGDYPLLSASGLADSFARIPRQPPLSIAAFVAQSPSFRAADLRQVDVPAALELLDVEFPATFSAYDGQSAAAFLDRLHFPEQARHLALEVFARSFFADPTDFSAGELVAMFHTYFMGSSEGLLFDVPTDDYDTALWAPLGRYLAGLGVDVRVGVSVEDIAAGERVEVRAGGQTWSADAVVVAADPAGTRALTGIDGQNAPPFGVLRLWLAEPVRADRVAFLGTSGFGPLDNVTVLDRFEAGAADWVRRRESTGAGGSVVELHAYAMHDDPALVRKQLRAELARVYPETAGVASVAEEWLVLADCPLVGTGPWADRPGVATDDPRVVLAGDGIRCDYPVALMERAATTGFLAANRLLASWDLAGHDLWTVPMRSRQRLPRLAHRALARGGSAAAGALSATA